MRVGTSGRSALLAGDIERDQEAALVAGQAAALRSDVLIAPHHGSRTSSTAAFLDAVQPATAVFQAGYRSRFGHPAPDVVARYRERGIAVVASPACGAWRWPHSGSGTELQNGACERQVVRRYWHHGDEPDDGPLGAGLASRLSKRPDVLLRQRVARTLLTCPREECRWDQASTK